MSPNLLRKLAWRTVKLWVHKSFPSVEHISTTALAQRLEKEEQIVLLDARKLEEYAVSHLPGAIRADSVESVQQAVRGQNNVKIVAYCSIGYRSARLTKQLVAAGYQAVNLEGSLFQWANEERPLVRNQQQTRQVHAYSPTWALLLDSKVSKTL